MGKERKIKFGDLILLAILAIFPFGQLPGVLLQSLLGSPVRVHPIDILVWIFVFYSVYKLKSLLTLRPLCPVFAVLAFSILLSVQINTFSFIGLLYAIRIVGYFSFLVLLPVNDYLKQLIFVGIAVGVFGWVQYFIFPDLTQLKYFGWDDHYFRLVSTFLDPAFTGLILVLASLAALQKYLLTRNNYYQTAFAFLLVSLAFTYSRASFLALILGTFILLFRKNRKLFVGISMALLLLVFFLPRSPGGEGVKLTRTSSILFKAENYVQSMRLIAYSPVFGVGFNNVCKAKEILSIDTTKQENSCSGFDNSFLFVWSTVGVVGFTVLGYTFYRLTKSGNTLFIASLAGVFIHSIFTNSLFYPWVLLWLGFLICKNLHSKSDLKF